MSKFTSPSFCIAIAAFMLSCLALPAQADPVGYGHAYGHGESSRDKYRGHHHGDWHDDWRDNRYDRYDNAPPIVLNNGRTVIYQNSGYYNPPLYYQTYSTPIYIEPDYYVGQRLVTYRPVPQHCLTRLGPPPRGYYYSMAGRNVVMVSNRDNIINQIFAALIQ